MLGFTAPPRHRATARLHSIRTRLGFLTSRSGRLQGGTVKALGTFGDRSGCQVRPGPDIKTKQPGRVHDPLFLLSQLCRRGGSGVFVVVLVPSAEARCRPFRMRYVRTVAATSQPAADI